MNKKEQEKYWSWDQYRYWKSGYEAGRALAGYEVGKRESCACSSDEVAWATSTVRDARHREQSLANKLEEMHLYLEELSKDIRLPKTAREEIRRIIK